MTGYKIVNLKVLEEEIGEEKVKALLANFSCPLNDDVHTFLHSKALDFAKQGWAQTHLVFASYKKSLEIAGYFALANKHISIKASAVKGNLKKRVNKFSTHDKTINAYCLAAPLIAQLGKNYAKGLNHLITGDELLKLACEMVSAIQLDLGGRFVYIECEDKSKLLEFYKSNGFCEFDRRSKDKDESGLSGDYLIQLLRYM